MPALVAGMALEARSVQVRRLAEEGYMDGRHHTGCADTAEIAGQFELILSASDAHAKRKLTGTTLPVRAVVTVGGIDVKFEVDGDIELA